MSETWTYLVVCRDLNPAQQMVQAAHAALESGATFGIGGSPANLVLCEVRNEEGLWRAYDRLAGAGLRLAVFREPDMGGRATALCSEPVGEEVKRELGWLRCFAV